MSRVADRSPISVHENVGASELRLKDRRQYVKSWFLKGGMLGAAGVGYVVECARTDQSRLTLTVWGTQYH